MTTVKVGQTLLLAWLPRLYGNQAWSFRDITVTRVGRKYAYFTCFGCGGRFSLKTMQCMSANFHGKVYPDRAAFDADLAKTATANMIERAAAALEIEIWPLPSSQSPRSASS